MSSRSLRPDDGWAPRLPTVGTAAFRRLAVVSLVFEALILLSGAAVRLSGSGLGCADWPDCSTGHLTPPLQFHSVIEFGNRLVTVVLVIVVGVTFLAALRRRPFRRDLAWLSGVLVAGIVAEAVVGGIVVYTKLNPYLVLVHFVTTVALLAAAVVLVHRATFDYTPGRRHLLVPPAMLVLGRGLVVLLGIVLVAGSATTGAAPDAGGAQGQLVARRIPVALHDLAELHATLALFLVGVALATAVALHAIDVPERVRRGGRMMVVTLFVQAAVGYTQYFTHLPAVLVEVHELGATLLVIGILQLWLAFTHHPLEVEATARRMVESPLGAAAPADLVGARGPTGTVSSVSHMSDESPVSGPAGTAW
ncbi:MAG: COX15/CtaA family protein [Acidimicrobiales bacterium]